MQIIHRSLLCIFFSFSILLISISNGISVNYWNLQEGDTLQWEVQTEKYDLINFANSPAYKSDRYLSIDEKYEVLYETIKTWQDSNLTVNITTTDISIDKIKLNIEYTGLLENPLYFNRTIYYDGSFDLFYTIPYYIPSSLVEEWDNLDYFDATLNTATYSYYPLDLDNPLVDINHHIPYQFQGKVYVQFYTGLTLKHLFTYDFSYVNPTSEKTNIDSKTLTSLKLDVKNIKDVDMDGFDDVYLTSAITTPNYLENFFVVPISIDLDILFTAANLIGGLILPNANFGFRIPDGDIVIYSSAGYLIDQIAQMGNELINTILIPFLEGENLTLLLEDFEPTEINITIYDVFEILPLFSLMNLFILPATFHYESFQNIIDILRELPYEEHQENDSTDTENQIATVLKNGFESETQQNLLTIRTNGAYFPVFYDGTKSMSQIEASITWDTAKSIVTEIQLSYDHPNWERGSSIKLVYKPQETDAGKTWMSQVLEIILILAAILSVATVASAKIRKNKIGTTANLINHLNNLNLK